MARNFKTVDYEQSLQVERRDDGLHWTAIRQQGHHGDHDILARSQSIEDRPFGFGECLVAYLAPVATILSTMHTDIPLADLSTCRTSQIGAKYGLWVHWLTPG
jgi:hypothetical protein